MSANFEKNAQTKLYNMIANFDFVYSVFIYLFIYLLLGGWKRQNRTMVCPFGATSAQFSSSSSLTVAPLWGSTLIAPLFLDDVINPHCSNCHLMANTSPICTPSPVTSIWTLLSYFCFKRNQTSCQNVTT